MTKTMLKTISHEVSLYVLGLISDDRLNRIIYYIKENPSLLLEENEFISKKINYMKKEIEYGNNYGSSTEYQIYQANISQYENLLKVFLETPELKKYAISLLSETNVFEQVYQAALQQKKKDLTNEFSTTSYSKFKHLEKLEDTRNSGEIEEVLNYAPQHAIHFILKNYKSFDNKIVDEVLNIQINEERELLNYLNIVSIEEIKKFPKEIVTVLKQNNSCLNTKNIKLK